MLLKKSFHKVENVFQRKMRSLKSLFSKRNNQNQLSRAPSFSTIPSSNNSTKMQRVDHFDRDISGESINGDDEVVDTKKSNTVTTSLTKDWNRSFISNGERSVSKARKEERLKEERQCELAEKLKEIEMVNGYNKEHVKDIEEALHYYSLITCPVYQDIVDRFIMDIYSEFQLPQSSASINNSMRTEKRPLCEALDVACDSG